MWQPRAANTADDVARYSKFVGRMRVGLPAVAGLLVLLVLILPQFTGDDERFRIATTPLKEAAVDALSMVNARYFGTDQKGQPFSVTAKSVKERADNDKLVDLVGPQADITLAGGDWLSVEAKAGTYDREAEVLELIGDVSLFQDQGYEMHTANARISLNEGSGAGRSPVQSQGPFGQLDAQGFDLYDKGERVVFLGPAKLVLNNTVKPEASGAEASETKSP
ncbi:MAG: LPS export ABC transporter periplasmic protein LptC [Rhodospirillaceae bacterium]|nr:LPS export ABC transporter periplasmic protein LptC [Rhodospirillaceae bacterium]